MRNGSSTRDVGRARSPPRGGRIHRPTDDQGGGSCTVQVLRQGDRITPTPLRYCELVTLARCKTGLGRRESLARLRGVSLQQKKCILGSNVLDVIPRQSGQLRFALFHGRRVLYARNAGRGMTRSTRGDLSFHFLFVTRGSWTDITHESCDCSNKEPDDYYSQSELNRKLGLHRELLALVSSQFFTPQLADVRSTHQPTTKRAITFSKESRLNVEHHEHRAR